MSSLHPPDIQLRFGARVRELREATGVSQEESAHRAGLDRSYLGQVERGERNISLLNIYKIARGLGCSPCELFPEHSAAEAGNVP